MHVVVIGIDRYQRCGPLRNAVGDAKGALKAFTNLGFQLKASLLDEAATGGALRRLVSDDLRGLDKEDSLVIFFAGHGHTETTPFADGCYTKVGYIMPVDGDKKSPGTWVRLKTWLDEVAHLPPKHILVILDSCNSGIALDPGFRWRSGGEPDPLPPAVQHLNSRRSRRIITSALDDQYASDAGPKPGHSLFTGCLIDALTGGVKNEHGYATGSSIGNFIQERVMSYSRSKQTPDFGAMELDDRGEMLFPLRPILKAEPIATPISSEHVRVSPTQAPVKSKPDIVVPKSKPKFPVWKGEDADKRPGLRPPTKGSVPIDQAAPKVAAGTAGLDAKLVAVFDRQAAGRERGDVVLSLVAGDPQSALSAVATWSAQRGHLTLVTQETSFNAVVDSWFSHMPWQRLIPVARARLATAAKLKVGEVDARFDARAGRERKQWIENIACGDATVLVSGWLLSALREPNGTSPDLATAPMRGRELLTVLDELNAPISFVLHHEEPTETWLTAAISTAAQLTACMPWRSIAVTSTDELAGRVLTARRNSAAMVMAKQGVIRLDKVPSAATSPAYERAIEKVLLDALSRDPRTRARFEQHVQAPIHERERQVEVLLAARASRLIVDLDSWYHTRDPQAYGRERLKDMRLQRAGFFVMRFLAEDVERRLGSVLDEIALGIEGRRDVQFPL